MSKISADSIVGRSSSIPSFPNGVSISGNTTSSNISAIGVNVSGNLGIRTTNPIQPLQVGTGSSVIVIDMMGDLGIGTTNPANKLDVVGDINTTGVLKINSLFNRVIQVGVNTILQNRDYCEVVGAGVSITLPSGPTAGNEVRIGVGTFTNTRVFSSNNIMGIADDFLIDIQNTNITFIFIGGTIGWRIF